MNQALFIYLELDIIAVEVANPNGIRNSMSFRYLVGSRNLLLAGHIQFRPFGKVECNILGLSLAKSNFSIFLLSSFTSNPKKKSQMQN